jgi:hypothetical protein
MRAFSTVVFVFALALGAFAQAGATPQNPASATANAETLTTNYLQLDVAELLQRAAALEGRRVTLTAEVVSINARRQTIDLFDEASHKLIAVSIANLSRSQRKALLNEPVNRVAVYGKVERRHGQLMLEAEQLMPVIITLARR